MSQTTVGRLKRSAGYFAVISLAIIVSCTTKPPFSYDFEQEKDLDKLGWKCRTIFKLSSQHPTSGIRSLVVEFYPDRAALGENYPGLALEGFDPNWSGQRSLVFDVYNPGDMTLRLGVRIDDREHLPYDDRYNAPQLIKPGENHIVIPFRELITSGTRRKLDLRRIQGVYLFLSDPKERLTLFFDRIRLE